MSLLEYNTGMKKVEFLVIVFTTFFPFFLKKNKDK